MVEDGQADSTIINVQYPPSVLQISASTPDTLLQTTYHPTNKSLPGCPGPPSGFAAQPSLPRALLAQSVRASSRDAAASLSPSAWF